MAHIVLSFCTDTSLRWRIFGGNITKKKKNEDRTKTMAWDLHYFSGTTTTWSSRVIWKTTQTTISSKKVQHLFFLLRTYLFGGLLMPPFPQGIKPLWEDPANSKVRNLRVYFCWYTYIYNFARVANGSYRQRKTIYYVTNTGKIWYATQYTPKEGPQ